MDIGWHYTIVIILIFLGLYVFISASEASFVLIKKKRFGGYSKNIPDEKKESLKERYLSYFFENPGRLLTAILVMKTLIKVAVLLFSLSLILQNSSDASAPSAAILILLIITASFVFIFIGELIPKTSVSKRTAFFTGIAVFPLYWINIFIYPLSETIAEIARILMHRRKEKKQIHFTGNPDDAAAQQLEAEDEQEIIQGIADLNSVDVREVMTPRVDIIAVSVNANFNELLEIITSSGFSRIPLYKDDLDDIIGIIHTKDILTYLRNEEQRRQLSLTKIARKAMFIPGTKKINDLLSEFQEKKMHVAIVVDEFGGTAGLITLEDILEEIIGEIRDEYDVEENPVTKIDEKTYMVLGKLSIDELNELLNLNLHPSNGDYETLAGLILNYAGQIPKDGYSFSIENYKFTVKEVLNKRIKKVLIEKIEGE